MRREIIIGSNTIQLTPEEKLSCEYSLLIDKIATVGAYEQYGVKVIVKETLEKAEVWNISHRADEMIRLAEHLCNHIVTPCILCDVIDDFVLVDGNFRI